MDFLKNLQNQSENVKRKILWAIVVLTGVLLLIAWWFFIVKKTLAGFSGEKLREELNVPYLEEEMKKIPKVETPQISDEEMKQLEEEIKKIEEQNKTATSE